MLIPLVLLAAIGIAVESDVRAVAAEDRSVLALASQDSDGHRLPAASRQPSVSDDGRFVAFVTAAGIDPADDNGADDVHVRDVVARTTTLISRFAAGNGTANDPSFEAEISGNGRFVVFASVNSGYAGTPPDAHTGSDIFLVDRGTPQPDGTYPAVAPIPVRLVSGPGSNLPSHASARTPSISADGNHIAYAWSYDVASTVVNGVSVHDRDRNGNGVPEGAADEATTSVTVPGPSNQPRISADGRHVVFVNSDPAVIAGARALVYDRTLDGTSPLDRPGNTRISVVTTPEFTDVAVGGAARPEPLMGTYSASPDISGDGSVVVYQFRYLDQGTESELPYGVWQVISVQRRPDGGVAGARVVSTDVQSVAAPYGDGHSMRPRVSDDGRYIGFVSEATDLTIFATTPHGTDCSGSPSPSTRCHAYVVDSLQPGRPRLISSRPTLQPNGLPTFGNGRSFELAVSGDGRHLAFTSAATNLFALDDNGRDDVFLHEWTPRLRVTPDPVEFPSTSVGATSGPRFATVDTDDFGPWRAEQVRVDGPLAADYHVVSAACAGGVYSRGRPCVLPVSFRPSGAGHRSAELVVRRSSVVFSASVVTVELHGRAQVPEGPGVVERVSLASPPPGGRSELPADSWDAALSANGRYVAFVTGHDLDGRDRNQRPDVYVRDRLRDTTTIVSLRGGGANPPPCPPSTPTCVPAAFASVDPTISGDGRYVAFTSSDPAGFAPEGVQSGGFPPSDGFATDVFLVDRGLSDAAGNFTATPSITNVSVRDGELAILRSAGEASVSGDGSQIAFTTERVTPTPGAAAESHESAVHIRDLDADGDRVAGEPGDATTITLEPPSADEFQPAMSADGDHVALVGVTDVGGEDPVPVVYVYDRNVDGGGRRDEPGARRYVRITTEQFTPTRPDGEGPPSPLADTGSLYPAIDGDGTTVAYSFGYSDRAIPSPLPLGLAQVLVADRDVLSGAVVATEVASVAGPGPLPENAGDGDSFQADLSDDGRYVVFSSSARNLHASDPDAEHADSDDRACGGERVGVCQVYAVDRLAPGNAGGPQIVSAPEDGLANGESMGPSVSGDGRFVAFDSVASNLLGTTSAPETPPPTTVSCPCPVDGNGHRDAFVREWLPEIEVDPAEIAYPETPVGSLAGVRSAVVRTASFGPAPILGVSIAGDHPGDFVVAGTDNCTPALPLAPVAPVPAVPQHAIVHLDTPCTVSVTFAPTAAGARRALLRIVTGSPFSSVPPTVSDVRLTGAGNRPSEDEPDEEGPPVLQIDALPIDFGEQLVRTTSPIRVLLVTNAGAAPLGIARIEVVGLHPGDFKVAIDLCSGRTLLAGENCQLILTFSPTEPGEREAVLYFDDNAQGAPHFVRMSGRAPAPTLAANPAVSIPGRTVVISGEKWSPNGTVVLTMTDAEGSSARFPETMTVDTDETGNLTATLLVFPRGAVGPRTVVASGATPGMEAQAPLLVVIPGINGPDFVVRR